MTQSTLATSWSRKVLSSAPSLIGHASLKRKDRMGSKCRNPPDGHPHLRAGGGATTRPRFPRSQAALHKRGANQNQARALVSACQLLAVRIMRRAITLTPWPLPVGAMGDVNSMRESRRRRSRDRSKARNAIQAKSSLGRTDLGRHRINRDT